MISVEQFKDLVRNALKIQSEENGSYSYLIVSDENSPPICPFCNEHMVRSHDTKWLQTCNCTLSNIAFNALSELYRKKAEIEALIAIEVQSIELAALVSFKRQYEDNIIVQIQKTQDETTKAILALDSLS